MGLGVVFPGDGEDEDHVPKQDVGDVDQGQPTSGARLELVLFNEFLQKWACFTFAGKCP